METIVKFEDLKTAAYTLKCCQPLKIYRRNGEIHFWPHCGTLPKSIKLVDGSKHWLDTNFGTTTFEDLRFFLKMYYDSTYVSIESGNIGTVKFRGLGESELEVQSATV